ncbi:hypothetical protein IH979_00195 [Patescibacteria group bacterium]|nr:hypothetical protein [Patescibacteria group bacterium]
MRTQKTLTSAAALLALGLATACDGVGTNPDETGIDTDEPTGSATLTVNVTVLGDQTDAQVNVENGSHAYTGTSGQTLQVVPGDYSITVGDGPPTVDGLPTYEYNGVPWCAIPEDLGLADGDSETRDKTLNRYFEGTYECLFDKYRYDDTQPDLKGEFRETERYDQQQIDVESCQRVQMEEDPGIGGMGPNDYLEVNDDQMILREASDDDDGLYVTESEIGGNFFSATIVWPEIYIYDYRCDLQ